MHPWPFWHRSVATEEVAAQPGTMRTMYCIRCPQPQHCRKKGSILSKGPDPQAVRDGLWYHLTNSPYHSGCTDHQVDYLASHAEIESWEEPWEVEAKADSLVLLWASLGGLSMTQ